MKRYYFNLVNDGYEDLGAMIPDGSNKQVAINRAKRWMKENGIKQAQLEVNSIITDNLLDVIELDL